MQADALREEGERLRLENEGLTKEVEQLQADRCSDVEELVYLRWINACLRHEMRNYQPPPGKTVARDLSKSLSPTSEKKAKQLIVEYANNTEGRRSLSDFDSDQWSSSQASFLEDSGECDDYSPLENSSDARVNNTTTSKSKIFSKLMRLIQGKDNHHNRSRVTSQEKYVSQEDSNTPNFRFSISTGNDTSRAEGRRRSISEFATPSGISRTSLDLSRTMSLKDEIRRNPDVLASGSSRNFTPSKRGSGDLKSSVNSLSDSSRSDNSNLVKYAEALKDSSGTPKHKIHRRTASFSSF